MGEELFGLLILLWSTISYITVLDFGFSRALTKYFSQNIGRLKEEENLSLLLSSILFVSLIGIAIGIILYIGSVLLVSMIFETESSLNILAVKCFKLIALFSPVLLLIPTISSFLKAYQNFKSLSVINSVNGIINYVIPLVALSLSFSLFEIIYALLIVKAIILLALFFVSIKLMNNPSLSTSKLNFLKNIKQLIGFGSWVSVSNFLNPLFVYLDRFIIATYITVSAVAIYGTPLEIVLKVGMIATAISGVLYAAISNSIEHDRKQTEQIINRGLDATTLFSYPVIITLVLFADEGLTWWVGEVIAQEGAIVMQVVALGVLFMCSTNLSIAYLHSTERPQITAKAHLIEFILYFITLVMMAKYFGLLGVAIAHSGRLIFDNLLMSFLAQKYSQKMNLGFVRNSTITLLLTLTSIPAFIVESTSLKIVWWLVLAIIYLFYMYKNLEVFKQFTHRNSF